MVFSRLSGAAAILSLAASVAAHGHVKGITVDGKFIKGFELGDAYQPTVPDSIGWATTALDNGFVEPAKFGTSDIACHLGSKTGKLFATVAAGSEVTITWDTWPESHKGPVLDYLAPYAETAADLKFFKIAEEGFVDGKWAADKINAASGFTWKTTIPSDIAPGKYVLRHEIIALHGGPSPNGAQNYPQCLNLEITGSGTATPAGVAGTALYTPTDPGILVPNFYNGLTSYEIPGPAVYSSGGGSAPAPAPAPSSTSAPSPTTPPTEETPEETSAPAPSTTAAPVETAAPEVPSPTSSKSKSACKPKTRTSTLPTAVPTPVAVETPLPTVTIVPTPAEPTEPAPEEPETTPTPEIPASDLPAGTKLSSVLSWLSKFYAAHGEEFDATTPLRRRHARQF